jgi:Eco57I restriction-modification methylase
MDGPPTREDCLELYDPCTKERLKDLKELEKRVREITKGKKNNVLRKNFPSSLVKRFDLLLDILKSDTEPNEEILNYKKGDNENFGTSLFESYWDIVISLGLPDKFKRYYENEKGEIKEHERYLIEKDVAKIDGKLNKEEHLIKDIFKYLKEKEIQTRASGASDITVYYEKQKQNSKKKDSCSYEEENEDSKEEDKSVIYLCSSKFYENELKKSVNKYDIEKIYIAAKKLRKEKNLIVKIPILVKNKNVVLGKLNRAISKYISNEVNIVYGLDDLLAYLNILYSNVRKSLRKEEINEENLRNLLSIKELPKPFLQLRLHQDIAVNTITDAIRKEYTNNKFLIGVVPRGGKTYIAGGLIYNLQAKRVLVILGAKTETIGQFIKDLFKKFQNFNDYTTIHLLDKVSYSIEKNKKYIFVTSIELLRKEEDSKSRKLIQELISDDKDKNADLIIYDEAHLKSTTERGSKGIEKVTKEQIEEEKLEDFTEEQINNFSKKIPVVFFTGTYRKPKELFKIPDDQIFVWDYEDIQKGKNLENETEYFKEYFGEYFENSLNKLLSQGNTINSIQNDYRKFPDLCILTTQFSEDVKKEFKIQKEEGREGVLTISDILKVDSNNENFSNKDNWINTFKFQDKVTQLLNYLSPSVYQTKQNKISSVLDRIDILAQASKDRLRGISFSGFDPENNLHTQLWFLPKTNSSSLSRRMAALSAAILNHRWLGEHFNVLLVKSAKDDILNGEYIAIKKGKIFSYPEMASSSLKNYILEKEEESRNEKKGLIILAQDMLKLGISLPCVDVVVLLDENSDIDERIQKMYRALTESENKKNGYIIDMNYFRTITAIIEYQKEKIKLSKKSYTKEDLENKIPDLFTNIYTYDDDKFLTGEIKDSTKFIEEIKQVYEKTSKQTKKYDIASWENAGTKLNINIGLLADKYEGDDSFLKRNPIEKKKGRQSKKTLAKLGDDVEKAKALERDDEAKEPGDEILPLDLPGFNNAKIEYQHPKEVIKEIISSLLKFGVFGTEKELSEYIDDLLKEDQDELREEVYELLYKRGYLNEYTEDKEKINKIITELAEFIKENISDSSRDYYKIMKEKIESKEDTDAKKVLEYINNHLAPKDVERHKLGEVFTPLTLVDEMLSKLPSEVWSNPDLKWLDPANGMGNFPIKAYLGQHEGEFKYPGLFKGLEKKIPDENKRCEHIIEKMLYMIDINIKNNAIAKRLFKILCPKATPNVEQIDRKDGFLSDKPLVFNGKEVKEFDIIMGNPPFHKGGINRADTRKNKKKLKYDGEKKETIWNRFVIESLKKLKFDGFLLFIHPIGWFHSGDYDNVRNILLTNQIEFIKIYKHDSQSVKEFKGSGKISIAYYLMKNIPTYKDTLVQGTSGKKEIVRLNKNSIILLNNSSIINKIILKSSFWKDNKNFKHKSVDCKPGEHKQISGIYEDGTINIVKTAKPHDDANKPKIIISGRNYPRIYIDDGKYGLVGSGVNYWIGDNLKILESFLKTKLAAFLTKELKFRQDFVEFKYFPDITKIDIKKISDETLADYFKFTKEEKNIIESTEYPKKEYKFVEIKCPESGGSTPRKFKHKTRKNKKSFFGLF